MNQYRKAAQTRRASNTEGALSLYIASIQKVTLKRKASNLEGVLFLYIESIQKGYTKERGLQSGGSAYRKATPKRERPPI